MKLKYSVRKFRALIVPSLEDIVDANCVPLMEDIVK